MAQRGRKSPNATLVESSSPALDLSSPRPLPPPPHLSEQMKNWWIEMTSQFVFQVHEYAILEMACDSWDLMTRADEIVRREGLTVNGLRGPRARPEVAIAREARNGFVRMVRALRPRDDERAPKKIGGYGITYDRFGNREQ